MADDRDSDSEVNFNVNNMREDAQGGDRLDPDEYAAARGSPYRHFRPPPQIRPDPFTGEDEWDRYFTYFEDCAELAMWSGKEKLLYLATSLKQRARLFYDSLPAPEKRSYEMLTLRLEQRFGSRRQQTRWLSKMQSRTRGKNEPIASFGDDVRLNAQKAYQNLDSEAQEMLALQHFYQNVSPEMRCRLMDNNCRSIRDAVEIVERYEDVLGNAQANDEVSHIRGTFERNRKEQASNTPSPKDIEEIKGVLGRLEERIDRLEKQGNTRVKEKVCYSCGEKGHFSRQCPDRNRQDKKIPQQQENFNPSRQ